MSATTSNADREASEATNAVLDERSDFSDDEIAGQAASLKQRFDQLKTEISPDRAPGKALRNPSRPSAKRRSFRPRTLSVRKRASASRPRQSRNRAAHESHCSICCHPDRRAIEEEFIHWLSPSTISDFYGVKIRAIYRHAHAFNLFALRDRNLRFALGHIIDRAEHIPDVYGPDIVRAVHAFARLNNEGQWVEPPSHVIVSSGSHPAAPRPPQFDAINQPVLPPRNAQSSAQNQTALLDTPGPTEHGSND
jgi:hypothetical protein